MNKKSNKLVNKRIVESLREIFMQLDSDEDGKISAENVNIKGMSADFLEAFAPLLCEMEDLNVSLTVEEFIESSKRLMKSLTLTQKNKIFYNTGNPKSKVTSYQFHVI